MSFNNNLPPVPDTNSTDSTDDDPTHPVWGIIEKAVLHLTPDNAESIDSIVSKSINFAKNEKTASNTKAVLMVLASSVNITSIVMLIILAIKGVL